MPKRAAFSPSRPSSISRSARSTKIGLPVVAALDHVVRLIGQRETGQACHGAQRIAQGRRKRVASKVSSPNWASSSRSRAAALALRWPGMARDDQLVLQAVLPAHQLGHRDLVAVRLQVEAAQHVGELAADLARVQRMAPELGQGRARQRQRLGLAQAGRHLGLAAGHQHHEARLLGEAEGDRVVGGGVAGMQRGHDVDARRQLGRVGGLGHGEVEEGHAVEAQPLLPARATCRPARPASRCRRRARRRARAKEQVVDDEAEVGLARAVVGQRGLRAARPAVRAAASR